MTAAILNGASVADSRPNWDQYYIGIAKAVAARGDCTRAQHGTVIVKDHRIVSAGYNGAPSGQPGCLTDGACPRAALTYEQLPSGSSYDTGPGRCIALHSEQNAVLRASWIDMTDGAVLYCTGAPCDGCWKMISGTPICRVVYGTGIAFCRIDGHWILESEIEVV